MKTGILSVRDISLNFGGVKALDNVSFEVCENEIFSIIGPNGAGKTSLFNIVSGLYAPSEGSIQLNNKELKRTLDGSSYLILFFISIASGCIMQLIAYCQSFWLIAINNNYVFNQKFPWGKGLSDGLIFLSGQSLIPFFSGILLSITILLTFWHKTSREPNIISSKGISRTFQNIRLFPELSILDNLLIGSDADDKKGFFNHAFKLNRKEDHNHIKVQSLLEFANIKSHHSMSAGALPYGEQRKLEILRALMAEPKLILLDEPAAGMNPTESEDLMNIIDKIRDQGIGIVLIEHHMKVVMGISDKVLVLNYGEKIAEGTPLEIKSNPKVITAYLGSDSHEL